MLADEIRVIAKGLRVQALEVKPALDSLDNVAGRIETLESQAASLRAEVGRLKAVLTKCVYCEARAMSLYCTSCGVVAPRQAWEAGDE